MCGRRRRTVPGRVGRDTAQWIAFAASRATARALRGDRPAGQRKPRRPLSRGRRSMVCRRRLRADLLTPPAVVAVRSKVAPALERHAQSLHLFEAHAGTYVRRHEHSAHGSRQCRSRFRAAQPKMDRHARLRVPCRPWNALPPPRQRHRSREAANLKRGEHRRDATPAELFGSPCGRRRPTSLRIVLGCRWGPP